MRLLIITQTVDAADSNLGFFVRWIEEFAKCAEVIVVANTVHADTVRKLPKGISVYSLGKETGASRIVRFLRYQQLLWQLLPRADGVFFHMCPEYVLGAHFLPLLFRKKTLLWYVHKEVSWRLRLAALLVDRIFTASQESCRLRSKKVKIVGHGIDTALFGGKHERARGMKLLTVGRISPTKDLRTLILGFLQLRAQFPDATLSIVGDPITHADRLHQDALRREFSDKVQFKGGIPYASLPAVYADATAFVHASRTGSMDKAVLEALAAGLPILTSSEAFSEEIPGVRKFREGDPKGMAEKISQAYARGELRYNEAAAWVRERHNLRRLIGRATAFFQESWTSITRH